MEEFKSLENLYLKYLEGYCSPEEVEKLLDEFGLDDNEPMFRSIISEELHVNLGDHDERYLRIANNVEAKLFPKISHKPLNSRKNTLRLWSQIAAIASVIAVIAFGIYFYNYYNGGNANDNYSGQDILPASKGATLTLANGKKVRLTSAADGQIANEAGVVISKAANGELIYEIKNNDTISAINTLATANGETYQLRLPDGSAVWLNSGSTLTYSANLVQNGKRLVQLVGEGYFHVAKDKSHPFIVRTGKQDIEVLGTQFNVTSYMDEPLVYTTLIEGSVKVSTTGMQKLMKPGQQAITGVDEITIKMADINQVTDWKQGDFNLNELDFRQAMREIARWYDIEVVYKGDVKTDFQTVGWISRTKKLSVVLQSIQSLGRVNFRVEGRTVYVTD